MAALAYRAATRWQHAECAGMNRRGGVSREGWRIPIPSEVEPPAKIPM